MNHIDDQKRELLAKILGLIGAGVVVAGAVVVPGILVGLAPFIGRKVKISKKEAHTHLRYARQKRWIKMRETDRGVQLLLTEKGKRRYLELELARPLSQEKWDGKWRIVIFDVPDKLKKMRDHLRYMLRQLGLVQLQESVWLTPWPCRLHVQAIRQMLGAGHYVRLVTATDIEDKEEFLEKFNLKK